MAAGAVVGAVKAAAQSIPEEGVQTLKGKSTPTTGEVLGEMAPDAAVGAVVGAARAVMPEGSAPGKGKAAGKSAKGAKGGSAGRK